jgi:MFS family permease
VRVVALGEDERAALQRRTLRVLVASQIIGGAAIGVSAAVGPLVAKEILGDDTFAGLAFAAFTFGAALAAIPLSGVMERRGRRRGLVRGYTTATAGTLACVVAVESELFPVLLLGMFLFGAGNASNLLARYAGADLAAEDHRARDISRVVWATTIGAVAGPNALGPAKQVAEWFALPALAGPYVISAVCLSVCTVVVGLLLRPDPLEAAGALAAPGESRDRLAVRAALRGIVSRPDSLVGLATMATAHAVMISIMTMTPLHLRDHGDSLELVGVVISLHIAGMYAFAPLVGALADRVGPVRVAHGAAMTLAGAGLLAAGAGHTHVLIGAALVLLGVGWSMATISGSAILTAATPPHERPRVQGAADMTMGLMGGLGGTVAGVVVGWLGYATLSAMGGALAVVLLAVVVLRRPAVRRVPA